MFALQSAARLFLVGPILDADGVVVTAAKTATDVLEVVKNGVSGAPDAQDTMAHSATGHYIVTTDGGDFGTLGEVTFLLNDGTNAMQPVTFQVLPANSYNSVVLGTDALDTSVTQWLGTGVAGTTIDGYPVVDVEYLNGSNQSLLDLKDFADTGYNPATHVAKADLHYILEHLLTQTGTQVADAFQTMYDVASPVLVASDVMRGTDSAATAAKLLAYMQVLTRSDPAIKADRSTELAELNTDEGSGAGDYDNAKAALEAIAEPMLIGTVASRTDDTDFTLTATDLTGNDDDHNGQLLVFVTGNNAGLMRIIGDYTGSTDRVQFTGTGFLAGFPNLVQVGDVCRVLSAAI